MSNINKSDKSNSKVFSRKELYDLVWSKPLTHIAKDFSFTDDAIRKICKKNNIPLPKAGHWSKIKHNKKVYKEKLPNPSSNLEIKLEKTNPDLYAGKTVQSKIAIKKKELEQNDNLSFKVPDKLKRPHFHVKNTKEYYKKLDEAKKRGQSTNNIDSSKALSIYVTKHHRSRALRIFDSIIKIIEKQGYNLIVDFRKCEVKIRNQEYSINIRETNKRVKRETKYSWDEYDYVPTGKLCFKIYSIIPLKEWYDFPTKPLEDKILNIIAWIEVKAKEDEETSIQSAIWHREYEKKRKKEEELKKQKDDELKNFETLFNTATRWHKSQYLRNYIKEFEKHAVETNTLNVEKQKWIKWAKEKVDWYDPFVEKEVPLLEGVERDKLEVKRNSSWY